MTNRIRWILPSLLMVSVLLAACATFKNTPQQDYTFAMGKICESAKGITEVHVSRVCPDGRQYWLGAGIGPWEFETPRFRDCMQEQFRVMPYRQWLEQHKGEYEARR